MSPKFFVKNSILEVFLILGGLVSVSVACNNRQPVVQPPPTPSPAVDQQGAPKDPEIGAGVNPNNNPQPPDQPPGDPIGAGSPSSPVSPSSPGTPNAPNTNGANSPNAPQAPTKPVDPAPGSPPGTPSPSGSPSAPKTPPVDPKPSTGSRVPNSTLPNPALPNPAALTGWDGKSDLGSKKWAFDSAF